MDQYHIYEAIGQGKYSTVYKGRKKKTIEYVAIKSIEKSHKNKVLQEVRIHHSLEHPNVLKFYSWYETSAHLWLIIEYCVGGDLKTLLEQDSKLPEDSVHDLARDLVRGLRFLHSKGIIYCDLKPSNILLDENGRTKLCDFGLSRKLADISKTPSSLLPQSKRGTPCYMAPELFYDGGVHSYASDFWALGCVLYECYAGRPPFVGREFTQLVKSILTDPTPPLPGNPSRPFANLVSSLLIKDPAERIQWSEICSHAYWRTKLTPVVLPPQPAFDDMIELSSKPNKTPPKTRDNSRGTAIANENSNLNTPPSRGISSARKKKDLSSNTKGVNLLRLSRIAKTNLQRENEKENYRQQVPNNSQNDTDVKIENTDMELDFNENMEDETQDEQEMTATPTHKEENNSTADHEDMDVSPVIDTPVRDNSRGNEYESSAIHIEVPPTPPTASPQTKSKRIVEDPDAVVDFDTSRSSPNLSQVLWHTSDLSVRPVMPSKKSDKGSDVVPPLPFDAMPALDFVKISKEQLDVVNKCIISILNGNTTIGEKNNVVRYLEMLSSNVDVANTLTNGPIMPVLVKMLRQSKASALRVQLASLIGLLIRHSTFIDDELSNSGILSSLNEGLVDRQEKVRRFSMAALGELLFYISTQNDQSKATNPPETPSKESRTSSGWQIPSTAISVVTSLLRKGEDDITQLYALRTIENISSQGGYWAGRFSNQGIINNLCYIFRAPGKQESMRLTAGSCLVRLVRFNPPTIQQVMEKLTFKEVASAISKNNAREQQICLNLLNMAMLGSNLFTNIGRHLLPLIEDKNLVPNLISLIEQGGEVLRGKTLVFITLLCKNRKRWLAHFFFNAKLLSTVDRLVKEKGVYLQQCFEAFLYGVVSTLPGLLESIIADIQQLLGGRRHAPGTPQTGKTASKTNLQLFPVVLNLLLSSSFKHRVVTPQILQQLKNLVKLVEFPFQGRDEFQLTLLRVLEAITEKASVIEENRSVFVNEILPSLSVLCQGSKDGDARFLCLKIWFEVIENLLNEAAEDKGRQEELKLVSRDHFVPMYPMLMKDEDPIPIYAEKLLEMLVESNIIQR